MDSFQIVSRLPPTPLVDGCRCYCSLCSCAVSQRLRPSANVTSRFAVPLDAVGPLARLIVASAWDEDLKGVLGRERAPRLEPDQTVRPSAPRVLQSLRRLGERQDGRGPDPWLHRSTFQ